MADKFVFPPPPWPEYTAGVDLMLAATLQRLEAITGTPVHVWPNRRRYGGKLSREQRQEIAEIGYTETARALAERYGVHWRTIQKIRADHKLAAKDPEKTRYRKVSQATRLEIAAIGYDLPAWQVAERFGICRRLVDDIRKDAGLRKNKRK